MMDMLVILQKMLFATIFCFLTPTLRWSTFSPLAPPIHLTSDAALTYYVRVAHALYRMV